MEIEEQKLRQAITKAIKKGWIAKGGFMTDVAVDEVFKLVSKNIDLAFVSERFFEKTKISLESARSRMDSETAGPLTKARATGEFIATKSIRDGVRNGYYNAR